MQIGAILSPIIDPATAIEAACAADREGLDAVGLWDHYHSPRPEWGYVAGWSMLAALAAATERVKIVPMVLNNLHYQLGVLAKETSTLALLSGGRFELGIGAGDWPDSFPPLAGHDRQHQKHPDPEPDTRIPHDSSLPASGITILRASRNVDSTIRARNRSTMISYADRRSAAEPKRRRGAAIANRDLDQP